MSRPASGFGNRPCSRTHRQCGGRLARPHPWRFRCPRYAPHSWQQAACCSPPPAKSTRNPSAPYRPTTSRRFPRRGPALGPDEKVSIATAPRARSARPVSATIRPQRSRLPSRSRTLRLGSERLDGSPGAPGARCRRGADGKPVGVAPAGTRMQGVSALATRDPDRLRCGSGACAADAHRGAAGCAGGYPGQAFPRPAGQLHRQLLDQAGIGAGEVYLTNTVKHFKFEPRGKARLHKRANAAEQAACRPWLAAELLRIRPRVIVCLGAMAAQTLFGRGYRLTRERGGWRTVGSHASATSTWPPSAILRMRGPKRDAARAQLLADLRSAQARVRMDA